MGALSSTSSPLILRCNFRRLPPPLSALLLPYFLHKNQTPVFLQNRPLSILPKHTHSLPSSRSISLSKSKIQSQTQIQNPIVLEEEEEEAEIENWSGEDESDEDLEDMEEEIGRDESGFVKKLSSVEESVIGNVHKELLMKLRGMSVKEKKELCSYANGLGKKLKSQQVGKSGVTDSVAIALVETLEANELLKLKIHSNCPGELDDVVSELELKTGSVVVGRIGRTVIIYRPSLTKLKTEEKKKQNQKIFLKRRAAFKASIQGKMQNRGQSSIQAGRSRQFGRRP